VSEPLSITAQGEAHVFLIGRPPINEYIGFVTDQTVEGAKADKRQLVDALRS
jgi:hypothetical protein